MNHLPQSEILSPVFDEAHEITLNKGDILTEQFAKVDYFYFLLDGEITFLLKVEEGTEELVVGTSDEPLTPIGWSGLISPNRYATSAVVSSDSARLLCWEFSVLEKQLEDNRVSVELVRLISARCTYLIGESIRLLSSVSTDIAYHKELLSYEQYQNTKLPEEDEIVQFLRQSPFFEIFEEAQLEFLARHAERRQYRTNDFIYEQGGNAEGITILVSGMVSFTYSNETGETIGFRNLVTPGFMVGWSAALDTGSLVNAIARQETVIYFLSTETIDHICKQDSYFAREFHYRMLWLIGHQLQSIRMRLISAKYNHEHIAISNLIEQNSANLELYSALHKVPHLLQNKLTIENGIQILKKLKISGDAMERNIAALCLDTVREITREMKFYNGLVNVYQSVIKAPEEMPGSEVRKLCARNVIKLFENASYVIQGEENLPKEPGHIFIYNHLRNHPYNTLPNNFQITLDSHFISSMILYKHYGDPGIRIVRVGRGGEYAHQDYYQRLQHIDVFTSESDPKTNTKEQREAMRKQFYKHAQGYLQNKTNLLISPEGTSYGTDDSPGPFKSGAFRLALNCEPEPYIVPIAIANFDKRIRKNTFSVIIKHPVKLSDYIRDPGDKSEMKMFLKKFRDKFEEFVNDASALVEKKSNLI